MHITQYLQKQSGSDRIEPLSDSLLMNYYFTVNVLIFVRLITQVLAV